MLRLILSNLTMVAVNRSVERRVMSILLGGFVPGSAYACSVGPTGPGGGPGPPPPDTAHFTTPPPRTQIHFIGLRGTGRN